MSFESDFSQSTAPDVYQLRMTVSNALVGQNLGPAQAHHILPGASIRANPDVLNWMLSLEANGLYKHNDISNALIMPTTDNGSIATGIAKHYGSHLGAPVGATDGYNKYVAQGLKAIREQWLVHQDDALAAKQITGFQNHLRAGLTAGFGVGDKWVRPELALQSTDPLFAADGASPRGEGFQRGVNFARRFTFVGLSGRCGPHNALILGKDGGLEDFHFLVSLDVAAAWNLFQTFGTPIAIFSKRLSA